MTASGVDILLVEDDRRLADLTAQYFQQNGLTVAVESRGDLAISRFGEEHPRVVLLDLNLPGKDGLDVCRELHIDLVWNVGGTEDLEPKRPLAHF